MLLSTLKFASYLSYSPHGTTKEANQSKMLCIWLKQERLVSNPAIPISESIAKSLKDELAKLPFADFFGEDVSLVPVPKSSLIQKGALWVPHRLVQAFCKFGLGKEFNCLIRTKAVPQAHLSKPKDRPKAIAHYQTIDVQNSIESPKSILLVDDTITRGATLLGTASRLHEVFPDIPIRAFAIFRTVSIPDKFNKINSPVVGEISLDKTGDTHRYP